MAQSIEIKSITAPQSHCDILATVKAKSELKTFGQNGMFISMDLFDGNDIKLTIFGKEMCNKAENVKVILISVIVKVYYFQQKVNFFLWVRDLYSVIVIHKQSYNLEYNIFIVFM